MNLILFFILLALLIYYLRHDCVKNELFVETSNNTINNIKPLLSDERKLYNNNYGLSYNEGNDTLWDVKNVGFSDIYNYEDRGGFEVYNQAHLINPNTSIKEDFVDIEKPLNIKYENEYYKYIGNASNPYYNQHFLLYESEIEPNKTNVLRDKLDYINYKIYSYLLVKLKNSNLEDQQTKHILDLATNSSVVVEHYIGPRNKININDVVYFSFGTFQLGPLEIRSS